jgi:outer membrane protein assembly factor BamA
LEIIKTELVKFGMKIEYSSLDFKNDGSLKQISATVKQSDGGSVSFTSGELTTTNYPTFKTYPDGSFGVYSQTSVKGTVLKPDGSPLPRVAVIINNPNLSIGTVTDQNGEFKLSNVPKDAEIVFSYEGFETQKVEPDFEKEMIVSLKQKDGSIEFENSTSETRQKEQINVNESNALVIVDGKEITKDELKKIGSDKIEKIEVLKNESAKATYGEKGKDGVILITLKNSENGTSTKIEGNFIAPTSIGTNSAISGLRFSAKNIKGDSKNGTDILKGNDISIDFGNTTKQMFIDGKEASKEEVDLLNPEKIESVSMLKDEFAVKKYGEKGKNGAIEITLRKSIVGNSSKIGNISWVNNTVFSSAELDKILRLQKGDQYSKDILNRRIWTDMDGVSSIYLDKGYAFSNIETSENQTNDGTINLTFTIYEGKPAKIGKVDIKGNKRVSTEEILSNIVIKPGDLFSKIKIVQSVEAISKMGKFDSEAIKPAVIPNSQNSNGEFGTIDLVFNVKEI